MTEIRREDLTSATAQALMLDEAEARALGVTKLMLETGTRQPEAIALYVKTGYSPTGPFGDYPPSR